jgi:hypothetical protein
MSTQGGLSRRRVANQSTSSATLPDSSSDHDSRNGTTTTSSNNTQSQSHSHAGSAFRGGGGIAYDPRDLDVNEEDGKGGKLPRLTIMEEVLLLGLKDKQVRPTLPFTSWNQVSRLGVTASENAAVSVSMRCASCQTVTTTLTCHFRFLGIPFILE